MRDLGESAGGARVVEGGWGKSGRLTGDGAGRSWAAVEMAGGNGAPGRRGPIGRWMIVVLESAMVR